MSELAHEPGHLRTHPRIHASTHPRIHASTHALACSPATVKAGPTTATYPMAPRPPLGQELGPTLPHPLFITGKGESRPRSDLPGRGRRPTPGPRTQRRRALFRRTRQHHAKRSPPRPIRTPGRIYGYVRRRTQRSTPVRRCQAQDENFFGLQSFCKVRLHKSLHSVDSTR